ncbi:hypothetical protein [Zobellia galactanivorans]|nr:hypothetical protein [Zobellia galactanivorans]
MAIPLSMGLANITDLPFLSVSIAGTIIGISINALNQSKIRSAVQVEGGAPVKNYQNSHILQSEGISYGEHHIKTLLAEESDFSTPNTFLSLVQVNHFSIEKRFGNH